jgi:acyl-CoA-binding protein
MADLDAEFDSAVAGVTELTRDPGNDAKLRLYALYKQATAGDVSGKRPGFANPVARAKYDAWAKVAGLPSDDAKREYVALVDSLRAQP